MGLFKKGLTLVGAMAVVVGMVSTAWAIEAFQERFEWGGYEQAHHNPGPRDRAGLV